MKLTTIILIIIIGLAILYFAKPESFKQYVQEPSTKFMNKIINKEPITINEEKEKIAGISPEIIGKPFTTYDCETDLECQNSYPKEDPERISCNEGTGECERT